MQMLEKRLFDKVLKTETCWLWKGSTLLGYGIIGVNGKLQRVHRIYYELHKGEIPNGLVLDHLCRVRNCVNPDHLEPVTLGTNVLRGVGITAINKRKTRCLKGHEFNKENTYLNKKGFRECKECSRKRHRDWLARKKT